MPDAFSCDRKAERFVLTFLSHKTLRVDRTAAERKHVAKSNPPQAENPAAQDSFLYILISNVANKYVLRSGSYRSMDR